MPLWLRKLRSSLNFRRAQFLEHLDEAFKRGVLIVFACHTKGEAPADALGHQCQRLSDIQLQLLLHELAARQRLTDTLKELTVIHWPIPPSGFATKEKARRCGNTPGFGPTSTQELTAESS
jgi:hypothetical protein